MKEYIRVGIEYFKIVYVPLISGDSWKHLKKWNKPTIIDDYGKESLSQIKKYESFCTIPSHNDYLREINNSYNKYEPLSYSFSEAGEWQNIEFYLKHLFGAQYEIGIDYLTILWQHPAQILPILCFVSNDRSTGKTTFLKLLKLIFENNMTINKNEDFRSRFNSDWSGKLIVAVDEVLLDKKEDSERIKNLSTADHCKIESKGVDKIETEFFGKFILCSNNEDNFIKIDNLEIRYWVIKVNTFKNEIPDLLTSMKNEIPYFTNFLSQREIKTKKATRMWFTKEQIYTAALDQLVRGNRSSIEKEIEEFLIDQFHILELEELYFTASDLHIQLNASNIRVNKSYVSWTLNEKFKLEPRNSSYKLYSVDYSGSSTGNFNTYHETKKGRFYTFKREDYIK